jgi:hypothetical protein
MANPNPAWISFFVNLPRDRARVLCSLSIAIGFNVETVTYKNINFQVWDLGGEFHYHYRPPSILLDCASYPLHSRLHLSMATQPSSSFTERKV